jgi:Mg2+ and Co2+ transporter CorA
VEPYASRRLLLKINRVSDELDIVNDVLRQQKSVLTSFRKSLDPASFITSNIPRRMKFQYEHNSIDKILKEINEKIIDCTELRERLSRLATQNVQVVETQLEDNGKAIIVFTVVTILFLPLSFVTGFFGMNLEGITGTTSTVKRFWIIALPLTFGVVLLCLFAAFWGSIRRWRRRYAKRRKEKNT